MFCKYVYSIIHQFVYTTSTAVQKTRQNMYGLREFTACMSNYSAVFFYSSTAHLDIIMYFIYPTEYTTRLF